MSTAAPGADRYSPATRVVITGLGVFSSIGIGREEFVEGLRQGRSGVKPIASFDTSGYAHANGCEIIDFEPARWIKRIPLAEIGRASQFSAGAARMAMEDSGLSAEELRADRGHISIGTSDCESSDLDQLTAMEVASGPESMDPVLARRLPANRLSAAVARELGLADVEMSTLATACSAGNYSIVNGYDAIRAGEAKFALCGGADAFCQRNFASFYRLGAIAPDCCRPFDKNRKGILISEGAGVVMLESLEYATARGARIYSEVLGCGLNCDGYHPSAPDEAGVTRCMEIALADAGVRPEDVDLISAHGTGTKANDFTETRAIRNVYTGRPPRTISLKSMLGHAMGAASSLAVIACSLAITEGFIPPTINHVETDPECQVDCVPNNSVPAELSIVQNNAMAFGGSNAVVVLGKYGGGS